MHMWLYNTFWLNREIRSAGGVKVELDGNIFKPCERMFKL